MELLEGRDLESLVKRVRPAAARARHVPAAAGLSLARRSARARAWCIATSSRRTSSCAAWASSSTSSRCSTSAWCRRARPIRRRRSTETLATAQQLIGTPAYMAPEMILGKDDVDRRADVYAIGCVAFYLLTGTRVFQDGNADAGADRSRAHRAGAAVEPARPAARRRSSIDLSSIVSARIPTIGRRTPPSCCDRIVAARISRAAWSNAHARVWWQARLPELAGPLVAH